MGRSSLRAAALGVTWYRKMFTPVVGTPLPAAVRAHHRHVRAGDVDADGREEQVAEGRRHGRDREVVAHRRSAPSPVDVAAGGGELAEAPGGRLDRGGSRRRPLEGLRRGGPADLDAADPHLDPGRALARSGCALRSRREANVRCRGPGLRDDGCRASWARARCERRAGSRRGRRRGTASGSPERAGRRASTGSLACATATSGTAARPSTGRAPCPCGHARRAEQSGGDPTAPARPARRSPSASPPEGRPWRTGDLHVVAVPRRRRRRIAPEPRRADREGGAGPRTDGGRGWPGGAVDEACEVAAHGPSSPVSARSSR